MSLSIPPSAVAAGKYAGGPYRPLAQSRPVSVRSFFLPSFLPPPFPSPRIPFSLRITRARAILVPYVISSSESQQSCLTAIITDRFFTIRYGPEKFALVRVLGLQRGIARCPDIQWGDTRRRNATCVAYLVPNTLIETISRHLTDHCGSTAPSGSHLRRTP